MIAGWGHVGNVGAKGLEQMNIATFVIFNR